jgi:hypothetical protein
MPVDNDRDTIFLEKIDEIAYANKQEITRQKRKKKKNKKNNKKIQPT